MSMLDKIEGKLPVIKNNGYTGAKRTDLTADWLTSNRTADEILRMQLPLLRDRSRDQARNNDYVKKFIQLLKINVVGPEGIRVENAGKDAQGKFLTIENEIIDKAWKKWGKKGTASICGKKSWLAIQNIVTANVSTDGEAFVFKIRGRQANEFGFSLQILESDFLDVTYNRKLINGNEIRMGIEMTPFGKVVNYHLLTSHPGDATSSWSGKRYRVIPAEDMYHVFIEERTPQTRGAPWIHTSIIRLRMLGGYEEAELVAARVGASKMGFFEQQDANSEFTGDDEAIDGDKIDEVSPGTWNIVPKGYKVSSFDPNHPAGNFAPFVKQMLRGAAAGMGPSYSSLSGDLESVNYSSLRQGALEERDYYRIIQKWLIENFVELVFNDWLEMAVMTGAVNIPFNKIIEIHNPKFLPRGWDWVDPLKEVKAASEALNKGLTSRTRVLAKNGVDFRDVVDEVAKENEYMAEKGVTFSEDKGTEITDEFLIATKEGDDDEEKITKD